MVTERQRLAVLLLLPYLRAYTCQFTASDALTEPHSALSASIFASAVMGNS